MPNPLTIDAPRSAAAARGGLCLSEDYANGRDPLDWRCAEGHEWSTPYRNVAKGSWCPVCARAAGAAARTGVPSRAKNKGSIEKCDAMARAKGGRCLSEEYRDSGTKMLWECSEGHRWEAIANAIKQGKWCPGCHRASQLSNIPGWTGQGEDGCYSALLLLAEARSGLCLSPEWKGSRAKHLWRCSEGHEWEASYQSVRDGSWCRKCADAASVRLNLEALKAKAEARGGLCHAEGPIKDRWAHVEFSCAGGHRFSTSPFCVFYKEAWCPVCALAEMAKPTKLDAGALREAAEANGGACLSEEYVNVAAAYRWRCAKGHEFEASLHAVRLCGSWCPHCSESLGESRCRACLEEACGVSFAKIRPDWLPGTRGRNLELDGYCEERQVAFEYQGHQHSRFIEWFHGTVERFEEQQDRDRLKRRLAAERKILLLEIPQIAPKSLPKAQLFVADACAEKAVPLEINPEYRAMLDDDDWVEATSRLLGLASAGAAAEALDEAAA